MSSKSKVLLFLLLCAFTTWHKFGQATTSQTRSRRLVQRYLLNRLRSRSYVGGKLMTWYCRRGAKLAICRKNGKQLRAAATSQPSVNRNQLIAKGDAGCSTGCYHGTCENERCRCDKGWWGKRCNIDVNECTRKLHGCSQVCDNFLGGYRCVCRTGYKLLVNGRTCIKSTTSRRTAKSRSATSNAVGTFTRRTTAILDRPVALSASRRKIPLSTSPLPGTRYRSFASMHLPARLKQKTCRKSCRYKCTVQNGIEKCLCPRGFSLAHDQRSCIDRNECLDGTGLVCPQNQGCVNTFGSFTCKCSAGYVVSHSLTGKVCEDVNECLTGEHQCGANAYCINTVGSHACSCLSGYLKSGSLCVNVASSTFLTKQDVNRHPWTWQRKGSPDENTGLFLNAA